MASAWEKYEESAAEFFRSLGLKTSVDQEIKGVRGHHDIDVFVEGSFYGIEFKWVVECKAWKNNIPKEKVMALIAIVQDIGADRGFLLSEKGFQSGAIRAATNTNITLTSIEDLSLLVGQQLVEPTLAKLSWRVNRTIDRLRIIKRKSDEWFPPALRQISRLSLVDSALDDAANGIYPNIYEVTSGVQHSANTFEELVRAIDTLISEGDKWASDFEAEEQATAALSVKV